MSVCRLPTLVFGVCSIAFSFAAGAPASAQGLSQFGAWGEAPERNARAPSRLGATPSMMKPAALSSGGARPSISPKAPQTTAFRNGFQPGSIVIDTAGRKLYYTLSNSSAYVYPIAVGKQGFSWSGVERVSRIEDWPDWIPPKEMHQRKRGLPLRMTGGLNNPLGAKAIYLGNTLYRIHGTNDSGSIGSASSSGCFRMHNAQVVHLAEHINAGTVVYVMRRLPKSGVIMPLGGAPKVQEVKEAPSQQAAPPADAPAGSSGAQPPESAQPQAPQAAPPPADAAPTTGQPAGQGI